MNGLLVSEGIEISLAQLPANTTLLVKQIRASSHHLRPLTNHVSASLLYQPHLRLFTLPTTSPPLCFTITMAEIMYIGDGGAVTQTCIQTYRKALNLYQADVFDECASVLREVIKTNPPIFWKCTFLTMLCVVTEHWLRAKRYRLHAEALWKLLDNNRAIH